MSKAAAVKLNDNDKAVVKGQYEDLPYPPRDPADEAKRLLLTPLAFVPAYSAYALGGREPDWDTLRILDAGGGTGDATVHAAEQLRGTKGEVVYLDFSAASREIAEARVAQRGLKNVRFVSGSILDLDQLDLGKFDLVVSSGVLHHLVDPVAGLKQLVGALKPGGALGLMVYAKHGRYPVYPIQDLMRRMLPGDMPLAERLARAKVILNSLGAMHPFNHPLIKDRAYALPMTDDAELLDLFLHNQDRAYSVDELVEWVGQGGADLLEPFGVVSLRGHFKLKTYTKKPEILELVKGKTTLEEAAIAELFGHATNRHIFFAKRAGDTVDTLVEGKETDIPSIWDKHRHYVTEVAKKVEAAQVGLTMNIPGDFTVGRLVLTPLTAAALRAWDGKSTMAEWAAALAKAAKVDMVAARREADSVLEGMTKAGLVMWRHGSARWGRMAKSMGIEADA